MAARLPHGRRTAGQQGRPLAWWGALLIAWGLTSGCGLTEFLQVRDRPISRAVRAVLGGGGNSLVVSAGAEALVVDPKYGDDGRRLRREVEQAQGKRVRRLLLTHHHTDHVGGVELYPDVGVILAHPNTIARLERRGWAGFGGRPLPWVPVEHELVLWLGGEQVRVLAVGSGHTDGDLVALLPAQRLLVAGDLFTQGFEPRCDEKAGGNILTLRRTLERLLALPFDRVLPGHGELATRADLERSRDYLAAMEQQVEGALAAGRSEDEVARAVTLPEFPLRPIPLGSSRESNVRQMFRALKKESGR